MNDDKFDGIDLTKIYGILFPPKVGIGKIGLGELDCEDVESTHTRQVFAHSCLMFWI